MNNTINKIRAMITREIYKCGEELESADNKGEFETLVTEMRVLSSIGIKMERIILEELEESGAG